MPRIRVLVVDDAVVVRRIVTSALSEDPDIEVVGVAANGRIALAKIAQLKPDLVTLDVEMPEMNGLETVSEIRKQWPKLPVIMFSTLTERGADTTLEALSRGASDYVTKPANVGSVGMAQQRIREELLPKVFALCGRVHRSSAPSIPASAARPDGSRPASSQADALQSGGSRLAVPRFGAPAPAHPAARLPASRSALARAAASGFELKPHIVAVGVSTGGPNALVTLVSQLPRDLAVPLVLVQHMPPLFTRFLAERLSKLGGIPFREAEDGAELRPGMGWIAPGDFHVTVKAPVEAGQRATLELNQQPPENSCRPAVDPLFRSVAKVFGARALAIVLTGMGQDGLRGSEAIVEEGGRVVVQDEATSVVWGMPGFVATAGLADRILPLDQIGAEIVRRIEGIPGGASSRATPAPTHA